MPGARLTVRESEVAAVEEDEGGGGRERKRAWNGEVVPPPL